MMQLAMSKSIFLYLLRSGCRMQSHSGLIAYFGLGKELQDELCVLRVALMLVGDNRDSSIAFCLSQRLPLVNYIQALPG